MKKVLLQNSTGDVIQVEQAQVSEMTARGYKPLGPEAEVALHRDAELKKSVDGNLEAVRAGGETAGDILTFGGLSAAQRALGADPEQMRARREEHPVATGIGTAVGFGVAVAATAGTGGAAALTPAGAVTRAAGGAATRGGLGTRVAAGAAEGFAFGIGDGVTEVALSDDPVTAEKVISTLGTRASLGAGIGGALPVVGGVAAKAWQKGIPKARALAAKRAEARAAQIAKQSDNALPDNIAIHVENRDAAALKALLKEEEAAIEASHKAVVKEANAGHAQKIKEYIEEVGSIKPHEALLDKSKKFVPKTPRPYKRYKELHKLGQKGRNAIAGKVPRWKTLAAKPHEVFNALQDEATALRQIVKEKDQIKATLSAKGALTDDVAAKLDGAESFLVRNEELLAEIEQVKAVKNLDPELKKRTLRDQADKIQKYHKDLIDSDPFDALIKYSKEGKAQKWKAFPEYGEATNVGRRGNRGILKQVDRLETLASKPKAALDFLQDQALLLRKIVDDGEALKTKLAKSGQLTDEAVRQIDSAPILLQKNDELRAAIRATDEAVAPPTSERLIQLEGALEEAKAPIKKSVLGDFTSDVAKGSFYGFAMKYLPGGVLATPAAMWVARKGVNLVDNLLEMVNGRATRAAAEQTQRLEGVVQALTTGGRLVDRVKGPTAMAILSQTSFGQTDGTEKYDTLHDAFQARASELRALVEPDGQGGLMMRMERRQEVAAQYAGIKEVDPLMADMIETAMAKRVVFMASKLPPVPDALGMMMSDMQPRASESQMRDFALAVWATDNPIGVIEKVTEGSVTPVEAEAVQTLSPGILSEFHERMAESVEYAMDKPLRLSQKISLSILLDRPMDPSLHPSVLRVLQNNFIDEPSDGAMGAPKASPQFGSVSKEDYTKAQERGER